MRLEDLDFPLPEERIALHPPKQRCDARLLAVRCAAGSWEHRRFPDVRELLQAGDLLVVNDSRVLPARVVGRKKSGGQVEGLYLEERHDGRAEFLWSGSRLRPGSEIRLASGGYRLRLTSKLAPGRWLVEDVTGAGWLRLLQEAGATPLPPYIRSRRRARGEAEDSPQDRERYQTVWAESAGSVAAPTASLHFDGALLEALRHKGVQIAPVTLHVGAGTFLPITAARLEEHVMHGENYLVPAATAAALAAARRSGRRIVAAGTTACRVLESLPGELPGGAIHGRTELYIQPGFAFRWTGALLTNFHTPRSTLLLLVAAFAQQLGGGAGLDFVKRVYADAVARGYRFYSYGDASLWSA